MMTMVVKVREGIVCLMLLLLTNLLQLFVLHKLHTKLLNIVLQKFEVFFEEERDLVLEFFDEAIVDEVINGDCIVSGRGDIERTFYFIFKDNISEEILAVYPIITK